jgi:hypothetical protein
MPEMVRSGGDRRRCGRDTSGLCRQACCHPSELSGANNVVVVLCRIHSWVIDPGRPGAVERLPSLEQRACICDFSSPTARGCGPAVRDAPDPVAQLGGEGRLEALHWVELETVRCGGLGDELPAIEPGA